MEAILNCKVTIPVKKKMGEISIKRPLWTTILKEAILNCKVTIPVKKRWEK
jgi:hypothetical protein